MFRGLVVVEVLGAGAILRRVLYSRQFLQMTVVICSDLEEVIRKRLCCGPSQFFGCRLRARG